MQGAIQKGQAFNFEGRQMTAAQIREYLVSCGVVLAAETIRNRLRKGETTVAQMRRRPSPKVNARWNAKGAS